MIIEVKVPSVGESVTSGVVSAWHKKSGEFVNEGEPLFALETDKVSTDIVAEKSGVLETKVPEGQEVKIGEVVAVIDDSKQTRNKTRTKNQKRKSLKQKRKNPSARKSEVAGENGWRKSGERLRRNTSRPAVRRIVEEEQLESGKDSWDRSGRSVDQGRRAEGGPGPRQSRIRGSSKAEEKLEPRAVAVPEVRRSVADGEARFIRKKMSPLRRKIAQQLVIAQHTAAILTTFNECDMSAVQELRRSKQDEFTKKHGIKLGLMSFFVKAAVEALKTVPVVNGRIDGDDFIQNNFYDIGVAVGTERGLVVPVVRDADKKSFADLERDIADYAGRARDGKLKLEDLQGGTFTITNGGVYGSLFATPILNPPQSGILGMHKIMPRPMAVDGKVEVRPMMYLALSYDHRAIDGKEAVTFLIKVKECIEDPKKLRWIFELAMVCHVERSGTKFS